MNLVRWISALRYVPRARAVAASLGVALAILSLAPIAGADSTWVDHYRAALAAHGAGDVSGFRARMLVVRRLVGDTPGVNYNLACAAARLGDRVEALRRLRLFAASGLVRDAAHDSDLVTLWRIPEFKRLAATIASHGDSVGTATLRHRFRDIDLLTEDLAYDPVTRRLYATSITRGRVVEIDAGVEREWVDPEARPGWGTFGAVIDAPRRLLWTSVAATPTAIGFVPADSGRTGLVAWDLATGRPVRRVEWPRDGHERLLGDLTVGPDGAVYACDSPRGAVRVLRPGADTLATLIPDGGLRSPQTPALAADGRRLYVAEYSRGIAIVDLTTRRVTWMSFAPGIALQGIDGLYARGRDLVAVQNGVRPRRVMHFRLDASGARVVGGTVLERGTLRLGEPTHGVLVDRCFVFLANTGWDRVGDDQRLRPGTDPPTILDVELASGAESARRRR